MFNILKKTAWATTLAVGGLVVIGTATALADDAKPKDQHSARPKARSGRRRASPSGHRQERVRPRADARRRRQAGIQRKRADARRRRPVKSGRTQTPDAAAPATNESKRTPDARGSAARTPAARVKRAESHICQPQERPWART